MKLDCGDSECFRRYNQPVPEVTFSKIIQGLINLKEVTIQSLFTEGPGGNYNESNLDNWIKKMRLIQPVFVQIYSLDRGVPSDQIFPVAKDKLETIGNRVRSENISAEVFSR
jgi:wyosine [tRNA(Phe)-imidazoG37] synthetase (radical SAM superfamily)